MELLVDIRTGDSAARTDLATVACLTKTLFLFAYVASFALFAIEPTDVPDTPYLDDLLYAIGTKCILPLTFLMKLMCLSTIYIGAIAFEPVLLAAWGRHTRIMVVVRTFLLRKLWTLVFRIAKLCSAFLIGEIYPHRDPDEATGLRSFAPPDTSPRFIHRWLAGTSPHLVYH